MERNSGMPRLPENRFTVDHQQAKDCRWQDFSQILYVFRSGLSRGKDEEGEEAGQGCPQNDHSDGYKLFG